MYALILGFITAFSLTYTIIPVIIRVVWERRLYDHPEGRPVGEVHPSFLGGIGIFAGALCAVVLWVPLDGFGVLQYVLAAFVLVLLVGALDDVLPLSTSQKILGQTFVAIILTYKAGIWVDNLHGVLGIYEMPKAMGFLLAVVLIILIVNAFNLIDGIDGLAGSLGLLASVLFGSWFYKTGNIALAVVAFSLAGAVVAFLKYNFTPAQIYMGDTGSLLTGTICAILSFKFVALNGEPGLPQSLVLQSAPALALAVMIVPLADALRVFVGRMLRGQWPFTPDKTHVHHLLLRLGFSHLQSTAMLTLVTLVFIAATLALDKLGTAILLPTQLTVAFLLLRWLQR